MLGGRNLEYFFGQANWCKFHNAIRLSYLVVCSVVLQIIWNQQVENWILLQVWSFNIFKYTWVPLHVTQITEGYASYWQRLYKARVLIIADFCTEESDTSLIDVVIRAIKTNRTWTCIMYSCHHAGKQKHKML